MTFHTSIFHAEIAHDSKCEAYETCGSQSTGEAVPADIPFKVGLNDGAGDLQALNDILDRAWNNSSPCMVCGGSSKVTHANTWLTAPEVFLLGFKRERVSCQFEFCTVLMCLFDYAIMLMCLHEQHALIQCPQVLLSCINAAA